MLEVHGDVSMCHVSPRDRRLTYKSMMGWRVARHTRRTNICTCDDCTDELESHYVVRRTVCRNVRGVPQVFAFIEYDEAAIAGIAVLIDVHAFLSKPLPLHRKPRTRSSHSRPR